MRLFDTHDVGPILAVFVYSPNLTSLTNIAIMMEMLLKMMAMMMSHTTCRTSLTALVYSPLLPPSHSLNSPAAAFLPGSAFSRIAAEQPVNLPISIYDGF